MIICVVGMHRSGTSMAARILNLCGVYLGREDELEQPKPENADGFWEHLGIRSLNDDILSHLGGSWSEVPALPASWETQPGITPFYRRAEDLVRGFQDKPIWGFKDPRTALTLPFWRRIIPDLRVVVPLRNPLEVMASLSKRDGFSLEHGLDLWTAYHQHLLAALPAKGWAVTHYDSYFADAPGELTRILGAVGLTPAPEAVAASLGSVSPKLRHFRLDRGDLALAYQDPQLLNVTVRDETLRTYDQLCEAAGPIFQSFEATHRPEVSEAAVRRGRLSEFRLDVDLQRCETQLGDELKRCREQLQAILASGSWRVTRPLRWLARTLNRNGKN